MCGVFGTLDRTIPQESVRMLTMRLGHRGPDGVGAYHATDNEAALGHCRLAILDLSDQGAQPMCNEDGTLWLTYNGEIYNFRALRDELIAKGHVFRSNTDSEVVLHGFEEWGTDCVTRFRGMFAFGLWDSKSGTLFLARDPLGIKPLYYYWDGKRFAFASELKSLTSYDKFDLTQDPTALYDFLTYRYVPAPKTPYRYIRKLPPASTLTLRNDVVTQRVYWDVDFSGADVVSEKAALAGIQERMSDAVAAHMISDVPVGVLLSGGVDSSTVVALASATSDAALLTFCADFDAAGFGEARYARTVADRYHTRHHEVLVGVDDAGDILERLNAIYDEPFADTSALPTFEICRLASKHVKVVLSGDGGDEVFGGYRWYRWFGGYARAQAYVPGMTAVAAAAGNLAVRFPGKAILKAWHRDPVAFYATLLGGFDAAEKAQIVRSGLCPDPDLPADYDDYWYFRQHWRPELDAITQVQYLDMKTYLPDDILTKVDRASMAHSLEVRPPLLDTALIEFVASVHPRVRHSTVGGKPLLKAAAAQLLPNEVLTRRKQGFSSPLAHWSSAQWLQLPASAPAELNELRPSKRFSLAVLQKWLRQHQA